MSQWEPLLEKVVAYRYPRLVAYAMLLTSARADAEDLVQDALVATFSGRARFATEIEAEAYVRRAIASRFVDAGRRRSSERARAADRPDRDDDRRPAERRHGAGGGGGTRPPQPA